LPINIILFDGVCNLCSFSVNFIIKHDKKGYFHFASIQSKRGKALIEKHGLKELDSIILVQDDKAYIYSDAVLRIAKESDGWYRYLYIFRFIPRVFGDAIYRVVAKYRYRVFGRRESCVISNRELLSRFLS
jgi:predicted DCC family thiol-disulfide oxidoreductase YuxK